MCFALHVFINGPESRYAARALARLKLEQHLKILGLKELADTGKPIPSLAALQIDPAERERLLKKAFTGLGTNLVLVVDPVTATADTNAVTVVAQSPAQPPTAQPAAQKTLPKTVARSEPASGRKGASDLMAAATEQIPATKAGTSAPPPAAGDGLLLSAEQMEARLFAAIKVSEDEQQDLIKCRAQAVRSAIFQSGKVTPERLIIIDPKSNNASPKGKSRGDPLAQLDAKIVLVPRLGFHLTTPGAGLTPTNREPRFTPGQVKKSGGDGLVPVL